MIKFIPGVHPSYKEQYDRIIEAYFKDEIKPLDSKFCFCGTLCDNTYEWHGASGRHNDSHGYYSFEFVKMENAILCKMRDVLDNSILRSFSSPKYEDALFKGMCAA